MKSKKVRFIALCFFVIVFCLLFFLLSVALSVRGVLKLQSVEELTEAEKVSLEVNLDTLFPERKSQSFTPLPYEIVKPELDISAKSAVLVDVGTMSILYEKNAEEIIPPASLTKIVEMYVVLDAVENGEVGLDDTVPLPPQSWAENLPYDASRMYLARGQSVTLRELLLGLAIASGNDASIAVANYISGNMDDFVSRMNQSVDSFGLQHTHFVESSGYSEKNITTAMDFAYFAASYIKRFPYALEEFHAKPILRYPLQKNLPLEQKSSGDSLAITQRNTNKLLDTLSGCDGLKTGFIYESGYNISVTAERYGTRFLSVTLGGKGSNTQEGNEYRVKDNMALFNWAFSNFADYSAKVPHSLTIPLLGAKKRAVRLVPAMRESFTVPFIEGSSPTGAAASVYAVAFVPLVLYGEVKAGDECGFVTYYLGSTALRTVPLAVDRNAEACGAFKALRDKCAYAIVSRYTNKSITRNLD